MTDSAHAQVYVTTQERYDNDKAEQDGGGKWFDLEDYFDHDEFYTAACEYVQTELADGDAEVKPYYSEFDISFLQEGDSDNHFETDNLIGDQKLSESLWFLLELSDEDRNMLNAFYEAYIHLVYSVEDNFTLAKEHFIGQFDSSEDFAREQIKSMGYLDALPEHLEPYFDFDGAGEELARNTKECDGYYFRE